MTQICNKHFPTMRIIHNDPDAGQVAINSSKCSSNSNSRVGEMEGPKAYSILTGVLAEFILWSKLPKELFFVLNGCHNSGYSGLFRTTRGVFISLWPPAPRCPNPQSRGLGVSMASADSLRRKAWSFHWRTLSLLLF